MDMDTLTAVYRRSHELGMAVHLHAIGDGALAMALDAIEKAPFFSLPARAWTSRPPAVWAA